MAGTLNVATPMSERDRRMGCSRDRARPRGVKYSGGSEAEEAERKRERERETRSRVLHNIAPVIYGQAGVPTSAIKMVACKVMQRKEKWPNCSPIFLQNSFRHYRSPPPFCFGSQLSTPRIRVSFAVFRHFRARSIY